MCSTGPRTPQQTVVELPTWARIEESRRGHVERVARLVSAWADEMAVPEAERNRWLKAVVLHDSLKDAPVSLLNELAGEWWGLPALRHGPAAAAMAEKMGESDSGVLDAVRYHSVGYAHWETVGKILFLADYLESGRSFHSAYHDRLSRKVPADLERVLLAVAAERLTDAISHELPLLKETTEFWNSLVGGFR